MCCRPCGLWRAEEEEEEEEEERRIRQDVKGSRRMKDAFWTMEERHCLLHAFAYTSSYSFSTARKHTCRLVFGRRDLGTRGGWGVGKVACSRRQTFAGTCKLRGGSAWQTPGCLSAFSGGRREGAVCGASAAHGERQKKPLLSLLPRYQHGLCRERGQPVNGSGRGRMPLRRRCRRTENDEGAAANGISAAAAE